ncbi:CCAR1-like protein [Salix koriyanagi]|uniref:CCAR1-like protein n=1 Tax=Salix koriyanagi TaxID=2511006 RepID=A0A9Q0WJS6_9ROSI|nr:CCAR1-like protein [Salix koriyanagi]
MEDDDSVDPINKPKQEEESEAEEDPEEDPEESEEMEDPEEYEQMDDPGHDSSNEKKARGRPVQNPSLLQICLEKKDQKVETELSGKEAVIDKELLEAFRFFDWNQTGYIRV